MSRGSWLKWPRLLAWEFPLFVLAGAGLKYWNAEPAIIPQPKPSLGLRLRETGAAQLQVEWSATAVPIRTATLGQLEVKDGVVRQVITLTPELLARGSFTHPRVSELVFVRLAVFDSAGAHAEEWSGFMGQPVPVTASDDPAELRKRVGELDAEAWGLEITGERQLARLQKLRSDLTAVETKLGIPERDRAEIERPGHSPDH